MSNETPDIKPAKNPIQGAGAKITEAFTKEWQAKFDAKLKTIVEADLVVAKAVKAKENEVQSLKDLYAEYEAAKATMGALIKSLA